jgi:AcrR family transcriptional regulator
MARPAYSEEQVDEILSEIRSHAIAVFRQQGIRGLTLAAVAMRMGWTAAALYRYFAGKDALVASIRAEGFARIGDRVRAARMEGSTPLEAARNVLRAYLGFAVEEPELFRLMYQLDQGQAPSVPHVKAERERSFAEARLLGADLIAAGLTPREANVEAHVLWAGCHGLATLAIADQLDLGCSYEELMEPLIERLTAHLSDETPTATSRSSGRSPEETK